MHARARLLISVVAAAALALAACGDGNPASPSGAGGVTVEGVLLGQGTSFTSSAAGSASASDGPITVEVLGTDISVTISGNGTFMIESIPLETFTLVFSQNGEEKGRIQISAVGGAKVKIVVKEEGSVIVLVDLKLDGDGDDGDGDGDDDTSGTTGQACMIDGGRVNERIELEGNVTDGNSEAFTMTTQGGRGSGSIEVDASGASFKCNGNTAGGGDCPDAVKKGAKVHVRGRLDTCTQDKAEVTATEVKVQKAAG